jgi:hypothetical protein
MPGMCLAEKAWEWLSEQEYDPEMIRMMKKSACSTLKNGWAIGVMMFMSSHSTQLCPACHDDGMAA